MAPPCRHGRGRRPRPWWPLLAVAAVALAVLVAPATFGGFSASVTNTGDKIGTGDLLTAAATGGTTECDLSSASYNPITAANTATCTGSPTPSGVLPSSGTSSLTTTISDNGSLAGASATLTAGACGVVDLANTATTSDPMLVRGTTDTFDVTPGPLTGSGGFGLSGGSGAGYGDDVAGTSISSTANITVAVWFRTSTTTGGTLIGGSNTPATSPSNWDKMIWVDPNGYVVFGVYPGSVQEVTTTTKYNDGNWHLAVATLNTSTGISISVDGGTAVTSTGAKSSQGYATYWHVGWDNEASGWTDPPSTPYLNGTLADAATLPVAVTAAQTSALATAGSQATWASDLAADYSADGGSGGYNSWPLSDSGTGIYTPTPPQLSTSACAYVDATVGSSSPTTACATPSSTSACATPSSSVTLATLSGTTTALPSAPTTSQSTNVIVTLARDGTNTVGAKPQATGLHVAVPLSVVTKASSFTATLTWATELIVL